MGDEKERLALFSGVTGDRNAAAAAVRKEEEDPSPEKMIPAPQQQEDDDPDRMALLGDVEEKKKHKQKETISVDAMDAMFADLDADLGCLDLTTQDVDFSGIDADISKFQEDVMVKEALEKGVDLRRFSSKIEKELMNVESLSIEDYIQQGDNLRELQVDILECDGVLEGMEQMLRRFQNDLGSIGAEIKHLQDESLSMSIRLRNRKIMEQKLASYIAEISITPDLIRNICDGEVNDAYLRHLDELNKKIEFVSTQPARSALQVGPELEKLRLKAVAKIREFLLSKIGGLKKPKTNVQVLQQNTLLKFRQLSHFLEEQAPHVALEVRSNYTDTMSRIYLGSMRSYVTAMAKWQQDVAGATDLLGGPEAKPGMVGALFGGRGHNKNRSTVFTLAGREDVLKDHDKPALVPHVVAGQGKRLPFEMVYRSAIHLLSDAATSEILFDRQFFVAPEQLFGTIFAKALAFFSDMLEKYLRSSHDAIGILLLVRVVQANAQLMQRRKIKCLDAHYDAQLLKLWPRFKFVFDANVQSVREAEPEALGGNEGCRPHYVVRRYSEFVAALLTLNQDHDDDVILVSLAELRKEMEMLLLRLAGQHKQREKGLMFLINQYDLVLSVLSSCGLETSVDSIRFTELLNSNVQLFVEEVLKGYYGEMVDMVKKAASLPTPQQVQEQFDTSAVGNMVRGFAASWRDTIEKIQADSLKMFPNLRCATHVLRTILTELLLCYQRFSEITAKCYKGEPFARDVLPLQSIYHEIKKVRQVASFE